MGWLQNVLAGDSKIKHEIMELAQKSQDKTIPARERLEAMFELGTVVEAGEQLQATIDDIEVLDKRQREPKIVWRNGAKVKA